MAGFGMEEVLPSFGRPALLPAMAWSHVLTRPESLPCPSPTLPLLVQVDLVSEEEQRRLLGLLRALNPGADLIPTTHSSVPLSRVINTGRFSLEQAQQNAGWLQVCAPG